MIDLVFTEQIEQTCIVKQSISNSFYYDRATLTFEVNIVQFPAKTQIQKNNFLCVQIMCTHAILDVGEKSATMMCSCSEFLTDVCLIILK